jgi:DNA topoisomerase-1
MSKNLVIVESPAKAKTIEGYLGKDFTVRSSYGHVRDLASKGIAIDIKNNFQPEYEVSSDKKTLVAELRKLAKAADTIWLATDEDREGEAISWHLYETLDLKKKDTKRITFNEITKTAILKAIEKPREINMPLVDAQQARRILDRLVGFELSPVLWKKVKPSLSAGRVQSVAVRLIVEREKEILKHDSEAYYKVTAIFLKGKDKVKADISKNFGTLDEVTEFIESCKGTAFKVLDVTEKPATRTPAAPFYTSTLQQEASLKLGFSVTRTMSVAQRLYEAGKITYMRTDSTNLSETAMEASKVEIEKAYGAKYSKPTKYATKSAGAQEAHEAIRPTDFGMHSTDGEAEEVKLYELIWKRAIASQMSHAQLERTVVKIGDPKLKEVFTARGEVIKFDGFLKVYIESNVDEDYDDEEKEGTDSMLPAMSVNDVLGYDFIRATQKFTRSLPRYVEASLVKKLEELGIGRPSTYAPTISTIQKRGYVEKKEREGTIRQYNVLSLVAEKVSMDKKEETTGKEKNKLSPTDIGVVVNDFLVEHFDQVLSYNFTREVEEQFDQIANGKLEWTKMLSSFYNPFHDRVEDTLENSERANGERYLGDHPVSGKRIIVRIGKFGPMVQIGETDPEGEKPQFASLRGNQTLATVTLEDAIDLFKLPRVVGEYEGKPLKANFGRFGPYVQYDKEFVSIKGDDDPMTISEERAIEILLEKREADIKKMLKAFPERADMQILDGRWGPYLKIGKENYKLPKDCVIESLTVAECITISENQAPKKKPFGKKSTATATKAAAVKKPVAKKPAAKKKPVAKKK